jgi:hypothetical protein
VAVVVPNPQYNPYESPMLVNGSIGFMYENPAITTLSANNPGKQDKISGLLYVPSFPPHSLCFNETKQYVPENVTHFSDLGGTGSAVVAVAPFTSIVCTEAYLAQMGQDDAQGVIFYQPGDSTNEPPPANDPSWSLHDDGAWLTQSQFPIYALPGSVGAFMMQSLAAYSGNITDEPYGPQLAEQYDVRDFIRLWTTIPVNNGTQGIPSLWVFLIIVLAILLFVVLITSFIMHLVQGRHRRILQRRVANGEVDLEALGIKRLNVPQEILDKMPQYVYTSKDAPVTPAAQGAKDAAPRKVAQYSQPTCPICLDDFVSGETTIRELPCGHIFHPECIDPFLKSSSSLCPVCKRSTLPPGFCPVQVTNLMVRRERLLRQMRQRVQVVHGEEIGGPNGTYSRRRRIYNAITGRFVVQPGINESLMIQRPSRSASIVPFPQRIAERLREGHVDLEPGTELQTVPTIEPDIIPPPEVASQGTAARRAWRRERLARRRVSAYDREARAADDQLESRCKQAELMAEIPSHPTDNLHRETNLGQVLPFIMRS